MKQLFTIFAGIALATTLTLGLWGCQRRQPQGLMGQAGTQAINVAPCYSGWCSTSCPNRQHGIACSASGNGPNCWPSSPCRGIILDK